jgi:hypothetical protein
VTITARPTRSHFDKIHWIPGADPGSLWIECECIAPPSFAEKRADGVFGEFVERRARKVTIYLSAEDATDMLLLLRDRAIYARSRPESPPS